MDFPELTGWGRGDLRSKLSGKVCNFTGTSSKTIKKGGMDTFWNKIIQTIILNHTAESVLTSAE